MRILKKILRIIAIILPCLCFGLISSPTFAKQYYTDSFIIHRFMQCDPDSSGLCASTPETSYTFSEDVTEHDGLKFRNSSTISTTYDSNSGLCAYRSYNNPGYYRSDNRSLSYNSPVFWFGYDLSYFDDLIDSGNFSSSLNNFRCSNMLPFDYSVDDVDFSIPDYNNSTTPFEVSLNVSSMLPYHYMFSNLYFSSDRVVDGVHYTSGFDISELLPQEPRSGDGNDDMIFYTSKIQEFSFNLNFNSSLESIESGSSIVFSGSMFTDVLPNTSDFTLNFLLNNHGITYNSTCDLSYLNSQLNYLCYIENTENYDFDSYVISMQLSSTSSLSDQDGHWTFSNIDIIINNDTTEGGYGGIAQTGSFPNTAPGTADVHNSANYNASLENLFDFSFWNPFTGLFDLFTDQSSCVNIPILAGMLNSSETTYCPWFSSSTRNILTPVLGITGMMLIFGFLVRWLKSSSGNMFEDSDKGGK